MENDHYIVLKPDSMDIIDRKTGCGVLSVTWGTQDGYSTSNQFFEFCPEQMTKAAAALLIVEMYKVIQRNNTWWDGLSRDTIRFEQKMEQLGIFVSE